jgi:bifunctional DNA-binding transcriptional regulator/antitoxin component of YhaV-PrlF toxin-antitoxin module
MIAKLQKHPDGYAIVFNKELLVAVGIDENTPLEVLVEDGAIRIHPAKSGVSRERLDAIMDQIEREYGRTLTYLSQH